MVRVGRGLHAHARLLESELDHVADGFFVIHHQDIRLLCAQLRTRIIWNAARIGPIASIIWMDVTVLCQAAPQARYA